MSLYTILGAGGSVGTTLAINLIAQGRQVRLVSRSGFSMPGSGTVKCDLANLGETIEAVKGSAVVFLCAGLPYKHEVWERLWPRIMTHTIEACKRARARLIFFDNLYMYGEVKGPMTEKTPYYPVSKKGEVRAEVARMLQQEMKSGNIRASIARAADLYGPFSTTTSLPYLLIFKNLLKGKRAQWLLSGDTLHSFCYTNDCAKAMILMANNDASFNQVWHLPCASPAVSAREFIDMAAKELSVNSNPMILQKWMIHLAGTWDTSTRETREMLYQYESDYVFSSSKFDTFFHFEPTSYSLGIAETLSFLKPGS